MNPRDQNYYYWLITAIPYQSNGFCEITLTIMSARLSNFQRLTDLKSLTVWQTLLWAKL